ncbi:hypothetical protein CDD82_3939 [Ophiocordyceps australis]|uniref:ERCC4 domain-containing protein n=1 Tax=Ophiocordyceps australis TaxID=1399860 RepID=A0A2C5Z419_9HYPO|nr:hypothetical protein CDD82_3939 [Ophiocordyceps australis]
MTPQPVIDLISSSPSPPSHPVQPRNVPSSFKRSSNGTRRNDEAANVAALAEVDDISDFTFSDQVGALDGKRKRRCTSPSHHRTGPHVPLKPSLPKDASILNISSSLGHDPGSPLIEDSLSNNIDQDTFASPEAFVPSSAPPRPVFDSDPFVSSPQQNTASARNVYRPNTSLTSTKGALAGTRDYSQQAASKGDVSNPWVIGLDSSSDDAHDDAFNNSARTLDTTLQKRDNTIYISDSENCKNSSDCDLPEIAAMDFSARPVSQRRQTKLQRSQSENMTGRRRSRTNVPDARTTTQEMDKKAREAAKVAAQETKRHEKELAKEARFREKHRAAALAQVNKLRTDKKISTPEMIVDLASGMALDHRAQAEVLLEQLGVEFTSWEYTQRSAVKWRRKVMSRYNDDLDRWEPIEPRIHKESHILIVLNAQDFVDLVLKGDLDAYAVETRQTFHGCSIMYLLQGMMCWLRKNRNLRNRQFASHVRSVATGQEPEASAPRGPSTSQRSSAQYICEDLVEDALLRLQVEHNALIHHTMATIETARWIATFTQHISTVPYKKQKDHATSAAGFCMESGQIRTGEDAKDTYIKLLQENMRITAPIAHGIAAEFETVGKLVRGLDAGGPLILDGVQKSANKDGQLSDRTIGQATSRRLYKVFTGRDELSTDV